MTLPLREDLRGATAYGAPQALVPVRLNTNENPYGPGEALVADIAAGVAAVAADLNRYPDRDAVALRADLAHYVSRGGHAVSAAQVWAANGSNEVLQQLLQAFGGPGRTALGFSPGYAMHSLISRATGTAFASAPRGAGFGLPAGLAVDAVRDVQPDVVFLCSPNNPTGTAVDPEVVEAVYDATVSPERGMVIVDEAYVEFSHHPSLVALLEGRPRLVVTRTMSKAFGFAGGRLGYLVADPAVVEAMSLVRLPYHLSGVGQAVARAALAHADELLGRVDEIKGTRDGLVATLRAMGLSVVDSDANFVLVGGFPGRFASDQGSLWQALLQRGVLVRDVGLSGWLRVTVGTPEETRSFVDALGAACEEEGQ